MRLAAAQSQIELSFTHHAPKDPKALLYHQQKKAPLKSSFVKQGTELSERAIGLAVLGILSFNIC